MKYARSYKGGRGEKGSARSKKGRNEEVVKTGKGRTLSAYVLAALLALQALFPVNAAVAATGSIWTTADDCGSAQQNVNHYAVGEKVYINGENFDGETSYEWDITGQPGSSDPSLVIASGDEMTEADGTFCFEAYTVLAGDDGVYKVNFGGKNDNYSVGDDDEEECDEEQDKTAEVVVQPEGDDCDEEEECDEQLPTIQTEQENGDDCDEEEECDEPVNQIVTETETDDDCDEEEECDQADLNIGKLGIDLPFEDDDCDEEEETDGVTIFASKVVCLSESDLPNWGEKGAQAGEPAMITENTAQDYVDDSEGRCWLAEGWSFQWGRAQKEGQGGVHTLPGDHLGQADGTDTTGMCLPEFCGTNTDTGSGYEDWSDFDSATAGSGVAAKVVVDELEGTPGIWVRENLKDGYVPFSYPPGEAPGSNVSAEIYCHDDIEQYDNYDEVINPQMGNEYDCVAFNAVEGSTINAHKVVCLEESDLPNWGEAGTQAGEPAMITASTAADYVAKSNQRCWLEEDWSFQYGFAEKDNQSGVNVLPKAHIGPADGTSTLGQCNPTYCGVNTQTGTDYNDWKTFDTVTTGGGAVGATAVITDLEGAPGVWVRENLQKGYVPFTFPPDPAPGSNVSAEMYCHTDIQNYDNYDEIFFPAEGESYNCVAFNAIEGTTINALKVVCLHESDLPNWGDTGVQAGEPAMITATTAQDFLAGKGEECWLEDNWSFQYGFHEKDNTSGVHLLPGDHIGPADGTSTMGQCPPAYCGTNTKTGVGYADWKTFDTSTSGGGVITATVVIPDLQGAPGLWVRENLQEGYVPFSLPPDSAPGSNVSAEIYCHTDIQNYDNYDLISSPVADGTYYCVAFNAIEEDDGGNGGNDDCEEVTREEVVAEAVVDEQDECGSISGSVYNDQNNNGNWDEGEPELTGWTVYLDTNDNSSVDGGEMTDVTESPYLFDNLVDGNYNVRAVVQSGWTQTFPADKHVVALAGTDVTGRNFGMFATDGGGGDGGDDDDDDNSSSTSSSGGRSSGSSNNDDDDGSVQGESTEGQGGTGEQPQVLGATLPRTGTNPLLIIPVIAAMFVLSGLLRARRA